MVTEGWCGLMSTFRNHCQTRWPWEQGVLYGYEVIQVRTVSGWMLRPKGLHLYPRMLGTYPGGCGSRATSAKTCALGRKLPANYSAGLHIFRGSGPADSSPRSPKPMVCVWRFQGRASCGSVRRRGSSPWPSAPFPLVALWSTKISSQVRRSILGLWPRQRPQGGQGKCGELGQALTCIISASALIYCWALCDDAFASKRPNM